MNKCLTIGLTALCLFTAVRQVDSAPVETDRYRVEFSGPQGTRLKASVSWSSPNDSDSRYKSEDIRRQVPIAFEIDLPHGSSIIAAGSIPGKDHISIKIFMNGFQCDDSTGREPSNSAVRSCDP